ncbi:glutamate-cysteine ligase family protein [Longimicrobium sp.]|uniref:glutamate-cysteine ligase family protein n=1 Tax=Longimicrobium sp. TaxID=2029185 RepID=UPI002CFDC263|nr:glutamate-cysteine ligase family protein [Longimicrobium sp.]HSU17840.1 glutamate-cysteine ligase family protein [Longimicrobium sp.]
MSSRRRVLVVVSDARDADGLPGEMVVDADRYLEGAGELSDPRATVVNLCRTTRYGSRGYYVSLLADARRQQVIPTVDTSEGLHEPYGRFRALQEAGVATIDAGEMSVRRRELGHVHPIPSARPGEGDEEPRHPFPIPVIRGGDGRCRPAAPEELVETLVYLGTCADPRFQRAALAVYREWPAPVLRLQLVEEDEEWKVTQVAAVPPHHLDVDERKHLVRALADEQRVLRRGREAPRETVRASIAVLVDPGDPFSPSSPETIDRLERVASRLNVHVARIGPGDMRKLPEYDALFIRSLTGVSEPAFQFALRAEALDMPVVDDPQSIIRCGNKVFLEELLRREGIPTPRTLIVTQTTPWATLQSLGLPFVIKLPDGSFSAAVHKITSRDEFRRRSKEMFARSPLLIAQEFLPTDFDWRVTVLGGRLLFASRYFMARGHWQIRTEVKGTERYGKVEAVPRGQAPAAVVETALRAASLIGRGLYGVDLKETERGPVVIEINDNPNLDVGYEDAVDGNVIYEDIVSFFVQRIEEGSPSPAANGDGDGAGLASIRRPVQVKAQGDGGARGYRAFEVAGMELEYPTVDRDLNVVSLVEPAFRILAGRGTSDVHLGALGFSNEIADHVFEVKTTAPVRSLRQAEEVLYEGVQRFTAVLRDEFDARLMPTGMHPWFDPRKGRLWARSGGRIYGTYERLFDVRTHGWMNVQASHLNLPFGSERETLAMHTAAALLIPYLPALAASTPMFEGDLRPHADSRLAWILEHQARIPESCGQLVPEYVESFGDYRKNVLGPMYAALDRLPGDTSAIRHEFLNARGAVFKFSRRAMEVRVLDTQECVRMDAAIAAFVRAALKEMTRRVLAGRIVLPPHELLVEDFRATIRDGSAAVVTAPHVPVERDETGRTDVRAVLRELLAVARKGARKDEAPYLELVAGVIERGSLSECIRSALRPYEEGPDEDFTEAARRIYIELMDCLEANEPWRGRGL